MGVALRLFCCYALYLPFYGGFSAGVYGWVSFLVKSDIGGILGVWRWYILLCLFCSVCLRQI